VKPNVIVEVAINDKGTDARNEGAVAIAGGALAEHLHQTYGDNIDAEETARAAREAFQEMMSDFRGSLN